MRIVRLEAENLKRLRAVEITPDGDLVVLAGRNAQGKSSILDAIFLALGGGAAAKHTRRPIRDGQDSARVVLDLGALIVTRTWTGDRTALRVQSADGANYSSPQAMLDALVGKLSFDPLVFAGSPAAVQRQMLLELVELPFDLDDLAGKRKAAFDARTEANRDLKRLTAQLAACPETPSGLPADEVNIADLIDAAAQARTWQARAEGTRVGLVEARETVESRRRDLADAETSLAAAEVAVAGIPTDLPDPAELDGKVRSADSTNRLVRAAQSRADMASQVHTKQAEVTALADRISGLDGERDAGLASAVMPLEGLALGVDGVLYQGLPLEQASHAERLQVSVAMAMAANPTLRVLRITDGSLLDAENMALLARLAGERDFQVWVEVVGPAGDLGVLIEDGQVVDSTAGSNPAPAIPREDTSR